MKSVTIALITMACCGPLLRATSAPPDSGYVDRINAIAHRAIMPASTSTVLELLNAIAVGRAATIDEREARECELSASEFSAPGYNNPAVRAKAFREIGELNAPDALAFVRLVKLTDFDAQNVHLIWPDVQIALHQQLLSQTVGSTARGLFLEHALEGNQDSIANSKLRYWAADQICDLGLISFFSVAQEAFLRDTSAERGQDEAAFCKVRMNIVASSADLAQTLSPVLTFSEHPRNSRLIHWAIDVLSSLRTVAADRELWKTAKAIDALPDEDRAFMESYATRIRLMRPTPIQ